jgi:hypothetical protein
LDDIVTVQLLLVPLQAPPQLPKALPSLGVAVRVTTVPLAKVALHVLLEGPQLMPAGLEVRVPWPVPERDTERV